MGFFSKLKDGLKKTRDSVVGSISSMLSTFTVVDEDLFEELEELLVMGDVGMETANAICGKLRTRVKEKGITKPDRIMDAEGICDLVCQQIEVAGEWITNK